MLRQGNPTHSWYSFVMGRGQQTKGGLGAVATRQEQQLFHGTSSFYSHKIKAGGLPQRSYLTDDIGLARYYAECAVDEVGGEELVLEVTVPSSTLQVDIQALEEPISSSAAAQALLQEDLGSDESVWAAAETACEEQGVESWKELSFENSLQLTNSVVCNIPISAQQVKAL
jgi:hypothetical protein